ncbi:hypothetical protein ACJRO7_005405 [Eucalyptus globulus]|uniref:BZIP domain-containing protein n=1 Tax=Eucalyptus globulus TaxID=34317 RepID=A0ABD3IZR2_EUCGL
MEEVWKDITLSSLQPHHHHHHHHHSPSSAGPSLRGNGLQDFLGRPSHKDPPTPANITSPSSLPPHHPLTFLSLNNSGPEFHFLDDSSPLGLSTTRFQSHSRAGMACFSTSPFEALAGSADPGNPGDVAAFGNIKKRVSESEGGSGDRRHKRMIKNRESAARSRARKQEKFLFLCAYTNELELQVAHLLEENARLKKQQEQLWMAAASQIPKKHSLHRTSTAPF